MQPGVVMLFYYIDLSSFPPSLLSHFPSSHPTFLPPPLFLLLTRPDVCQCEPFWTGPDCATPQCTV